MRRVLPIILLLLVLAAPASARTAAGRHSSAKTTSCAPDNGAATFSAKFTGSMRRYGRAKGLEMRFALYTRTKVTPQWTHVTPVDGFDTWEVAGPGVTRYIYDQTVHALVPGASYRTSIRYRWRNDSGKIIAHAEHVTPICHEPDQRANLKVKKITLRPAGKGMRIYVVKILNGGGTAAPVFDTGLLVNGIAQPDQATGGELAPGGTAELSFTAPVCTAGSTLTATADTTNAVDERSETDNVLSIPCPVGGRNA